MFLLQPMLQELGKQNPHLMRLIRDHQADFLRLINEPMEGGEGWGSFFAVLCKLSYFLIVLGDWRGVVLLSFLLVGLCPLAYFLPLTCFRNILGQLPGGMPQAVTVTPEERQAIERVSLTSWLHNALID